MNKKESNNKPFYCPQCGQLGWGDAEPDVFNPNWRLICRLCAGEVYNSRQEWERLRMGKVVTKDKQ